MADDATEDQIIQRESGRKPYIGYGEVDLSKAPKDKYGFPIWEGRMGPEGISHAAGLYQFEPKTWAEGAAALGINDFSPESQKQVFDYIHAKYGNAPWAASAPGMQREGTYSGATHINVQPHDEDNLGQVLLGNLLMRAPPSRQQDQGNAPKPPSLLDNLLSQALNPQSGNAPKPQGPPPAPPPVTPGAPAKNVLPQQAVSGATTGGGNLAATQGAAPAVRPMPAPAPAAAAAGPGRGLLEGILSHLSVGRAAPNNLMPLGRALTAPDVTTKQPSNEQAQANPGKTIVDGLLQRVLGNPVGEQIAMDQGDTSLSMRRPGGPGPVAIALGTAGGGEGAMGRVEPPSLRMGGERIEPTIEGGPGAAPPQAQGPQAAPPANAPGPDLIPPAGVKATARSLDDALYTTLKNNEADMIEARQFVEGLPEEWLTPQFSEQHYTEAEERLKGPRTLSPDVAKAEAAMKPIDDDIHRIATDLRTTHPELAEEMPDLLTAEQGYVHRKLIGRPGPGERLDPGIGKDVIGVSGRNLGKRAASLEKRTQNFVGEDEAGNRLWSQKLLGEKLPPEPPGYTRLFYDKGDKTWTRERGKATHYSDFPTNRLPANQGAASEPKYWLKHSDDLLRHATQAPPQKYGDTYQMGGKTYTARRPTTQEIEANTPRRYVKNRIANTIDNWLRLRRIQRNIKLLDEWKPKLEGEGLWSPETNLIPPGRVFVDIPQMRGHAEPWIAHTLNDFYRTSQDDIAGFLAKANRFLIGTMFALPFRHQLNVATHYAIGRGFDWARDNPQLIRATKAVTEQNQDYLRLLRAGAGLQYANTLNQNFYKVMLEKLFHDQIHDPGWEEGVAKHLGVKVADMVKAEYEWSRKALWKVNDVFLVGRIMELEGKGIPTAEAIRRAEQEIPNYRIPAEVANSRMLATALKNPVFIAFGRYTYGKYRAIAETVKNMIGPAAGGEPGRRMEALGQAVVMAMLGTVGYKAANYALQSTMQKAGYKGKPMEFVRGGPLGVMAAARDLGGYMLGLDQGERDLASWMSTLISPAPGFEMAAQALGGFKNQFTGQSLYDPRSTPLGKAVQVGEYLAQGIYPLELAIDMARRGPLPALGPSVGVKQAYQPPPGRVQKMLRGQARARERHDPIEQFIRRNAP